MLAGGGEVMTSVEGLVSAGSKCCLLRKDQQGPVAVAAALQVAQDVRDVLEVCAAQLVRKNAAMSVNRGSENSPPAPEGRETASKRTGAVRWLFSSFVPPPPHVSFSGPFRSYSMYVPLLAVFCFGLPS